MALSPGTRLGPYEIETPLGAGGMGEVYRARDTRLDRTVAVKVLPSRVSEDPRLQKRFEREARALAGLSHPRICALHDVGHERDIRFLVMELLEGETLAVRLSRGALPLDQAINAGIEIADALDAAHRQGVVHRDVKPGNIMLTKNGAKLLDFGLARDTPPLAAQAPTDNSETATRGTAITAEGAIIGTLNYMAPEQLEGREVDARTDLFALGSMLYEMTTGTPPFQGNSQAGLVAAILTAEPRPMAEIRSTTPASLSRAVNRCLAKDPEARWQSARDLMLELQWIAEGGSLDGNEPAAARSSWRDRIAWGLSFGLLAAVLTFFVGRPERAPQPSPLRRLSVALPDGVSSYLSRVSPDGSTLAISLSSQGQRQLWLRPLDSLSSEPIPGTEGGLFPFWSPDGRYVGFFANGTLKKVDLLGGPPEVLCEAPGPFSLGTWNRHGAILFNIVETPGRDGVYRVSDAGGTPTKLTILDISDQELFGVWPSFLPDGTHFLLTCATNEDQGPAGLCVVSLETGYASLVLPMRSERGFRAEFAAPGYLVYTREGALMAQPFDSSERVVSGEPVRIAEQILALGPVGLDSFSVSGDVLAYQTESFHSELIWKDRNGRTVGRVGSPGAYTDVTLGPKGQEVAVGLYDPQAARSDIWLIELDRDVATRFSTGIGDDMGALWSPDGRSVAFSSARDNPPFMHVKSVTGGDEEVLLPSRGTLQVANDWSSDGRQIVYSDRDPSTGWDLWVLPLDGERDPVPFLRTPFNEMGASFSPDGKLVAYASDETDSMEVYVTRFPGAGEKHRVSTGGGYLPRWRNDGNELFFLSLDDRLMAAPVRSGPSFDTETPIALFSFKPADGALLPYDISPDGERFIVISAMPGQATTPTVVTGWSRQLPR